MANPKIIYFLIALLLSAQFDDMWVSDTVLSSSPVAGDDDEYLPSERQQHSAQSTTRHELAHLGLTQQTANSFSIRPSLGSGSELAAAYGPSPLYLFMSLQC